jgi:DNA-binding NtrC family response regulator
MEGTILIIDDKLKVCKSLAQNFEQRGYQTLYATNGPEALGLFARQMFHAVLLDIMLGEESGMEILKELLLVRGETPVIMMTGYASIDTAVQAIKLGAFDYITKPLDFDKLFKLVENAVKIAKLREEQAHGNGQAIAGLPRIMTRSKTMTELCQKAQKLAATDLPILITGENGTGKEILADFIHAHSTRHARKILKMNCAAFPESLLDNELFGHEKGAYTGADAAFKGVFERAHESSLFLDEIGDMPLTIQAKILRTLQNREIRRIGGNHTITIDVRFMAATNKPIHTLIQDKSFREDLFYRLNTAMLHVPPLRERKEDIPLLVEHFVTEYFRTTSSHLKTVSDDVLDHFFNYHWPGNVRELKNVITYAAAMASTDAIGLDDLPPHFLPPEAQQASNSNVRAEMEKTLILKTLQKADYNKKKAAELLNMSRKTLYNKLEKYGIATPK